MHRVNPRASQAQFRLAAVVSLLALAIAGCNPASDSTGGSPHTPGTRAPSSGVVNRAPDISGQPQLSALVNVYYEFTPSATDPDGDALRFEIVGKPAWASFDSRTGRLYGTPSSSSTGTFQNIQIAVSDGAAKSTLPGFTVTVREGGGSLGSATLRWVAPTQTSAGEPLTDLEGFHIYYGQSSASLDRIVTIADRYATQKVIGNLNAGTWFFTVTAYTKTGAESSHSNMVSKDI